MAPQQEDDYEAIYQYLTTGDLPQNFMETRIQKSNFKRKAEKFLVSNGVLFRRQGPTNHRSVPQAQKPLPTGVTPICGYMQAQDAVKWQMYELVPGSGVFIHQENFDIVMSKKREGEMDGKAMARYLMNCFWKQGDLLGASLAEPPRPHQYALDRGIINAILDFCTHMSKVKRSVLRNILSSKVTKTNSLYRQQMGMPPRKAGRPVRYPLY